MKTDDLILVSIDDHVVEPPDMFLNHVPAKYKSEAPIVVTDDKGVDQWMYQGRPQGVSGLNAVVSWPPEELSLLPLLHHLQPPTGFHPLAFNRFVRCCSTRPRNSA